MLTYHLKPNSKVFIFFIYTGTKWWRQRIITFNKTLLSKVTETHWHKEFVNYKWPKANFSAGSVKENFLSENLQKLLQGCSSVRPQPPQTHPHTQLSKHTHTHTHTADFSLFIMTQHHHIQCVASLLHVIPTGNDATWTQRVSCICMFLYTPTIMWG